MQDSDSGGSVRGEEFTSDGNIPPTNQKKHGGERSNVTATRKLLDIIFDVLTKGWSESKEM